MYDLKTDTDSFLTSFINDYAEDTLSDGELAALNEFFSCYPTLSSFADNSSKGRKALKNAFNVTAADDFEEKLRRRINIEIDDDEMLNNVSKRYFYISLAVMFL